MSKIEAENNSHVPNRRIVRRNFIYDATGTVGSNIFLVLVGSFLAVLVRKEGGSGSEIAILAAAPYIGNFSTFFLINYLPKKYPQRFIAITLALSRALFLTVGFLTSAAQLVFLGFIYYFLVAMTMSVTLNVVRFMYPPLQRGRLMSSARFVGSCVALGLGPLGGVLIDRFGYVPIIVVAALIAILFALPYAFIQPFAPEAFRISVPHPGLFASLRLYLENRRYALYVMGWTIWGLGYFMTLPLISLLLVDVFHASYSFTGNLLFIQTACTLVSYLWWGRFLDRRGPFLTLQIAFAGVSIAVFSYGLIPVETPFLLIVPAVLIGLTSGAIDLGGSTALISMAPEGETSRYLATMNLATGLRGSFVPFLGIALAQADFPGLRFTFIIGSVIAFAGLFFLTLAARQVSS